MSVFAAMKETAAADLALLKSNDAAGDVFSVPRDVDFAFKTTDAERADGLCRYINDYSYAAARMQPAQPDGTVWVIAVIHMPINQNIINSVSAFMTFLAHTFRVEYDGWGSVMQHKLDNEGHGPGVPTHDDH